MLALLTFLICCFVLAPIVVSISAGLVNNYSTGLSSGLTTRWLIQVAQTYGDTIVASLILGVLCVVITLLIGTPTAYALARWRSRSSVVIQEFLMMPVAIPGLATALALILAYGQIRWFRQSYGFILVGHIIFTLPFLLRILIAAMQRREIIAMEEAAATLGAGFRTRLVGVVVPAILPAIASAALMVFTLSIGEFNLTWMLHTPLTRTLPVGLADSYASMRLEVGSAYTILFLSVVLPVLWMMQTIARRIERQHAD
jgi:putative spermidine/putrescine transport system permease protein